jgi:hypothetical protein
VTVSVVSLVSFASLLLTQPGQAARPAARTIPARSATGPLVRSVPQHAGTASHPLRAGDVRPTRALPPGYVLVDPVVSNTDTTLKNNDTFTDWEPSLAVNCCTIVITTFSGFWGSGNAPLWRSRDDGVTWSKVYSIPKPTGATVNGGCPCDQVVDYGRNGTLVGTFLDEVSTGVGAIYTGSTTNSGQASSWTWKTVNGVAKRTENPTGDDVDQPWVRVTRDPVTASQDNVYVGYDDFTDPADLRVSVSLGASPPNFTYTRRIGFDNGFVNPGTRLAVDQRNGTVYALYQYATQRNTDGSVHILYGLNRSTDAGDTWTLNDSSTGMLVAEANSDQPRPKFGGVNALLGGVDSVAVDQSNGDVYVAYGTIDPNTGYNRIKVAHLVSDGSGGLTVASRKYLPGQYESALPSIAVANGTVGVLFDRFVGYNASGFPIFSANLAQSTDHGLHWTNVKLLQFASPVKDDTSDTRQRILGDYQSLRSFGGYFYGAFSGNGAQFGRSGSNIDPVFIKAPANSA